MKSLPPEQSSGSLSEAQAASGRHISRYLQSGDRDKPLVILIHGWPERAISWRHTLRFLADQGYCAVAPDMRGYGGSSCYSRHEDYAVEEAVQDMLELLAALGHERAIWIGHDWGSPVVWALASHHPQRCRAVANLCVPYQPGGFTLDSLVPLVDRNIYPAQTFPAGQWEYFLYYREHFAHAQACLEADIPATVKALFRSGKPESIGKPAVLAYTRIQGGWFGGAAKAPALPMDTRVLDEASLAVYVEGLQRNGFHGPGSWYMNDARNGDYAARAPGGGRIDLPVLFLHGRFDSTCETVQSRLAEPMRAACSRLTEVIVDSGHWMAQENPEAVHKALSAWLPTL